MLVLNKYHNEGIGGTTWLAKRGVSRNTSTSVIVIIVMLAVECVPEKSGQKLNNKCIYNVTAAGMVLNSCSWCCIHMPVQYCC